MKSCGLFMVKKMTTLKPDVNLTTSLSEGDYGAWETFEAFTEANQYKLILFGIVGVEIFTEKIFLIRLISS